MSKEVLIIFIRNPEIGKVKTRLAKTIGNNAALQLYKLLLQHTFEATQNINYDKIVYYSEAIEKNDIWDASYQKKIQQGNDLGQRMYHAFETVFKAGYKKAVIIGSDIFDLTPAHIKEAFTMLNTYDTVLGPAEDGGYYLLGMKQLHPGIFKEKTWGTATVLAETLKDLKGIKTHFLETLNDIDTYEDLKKVNTFKSFLKL